MPAAEYIYLIQSDYLLFVKIGRSSGSIKKLQNRYTTYYPNMDYILYQCSDNVSLEKTARVGA